MHCWGKYIYKERGKKSGRKYENEQLMYHKFIVCKNGQVIKVVKNFLF